MAKGKLQEAIERVIEEIRFQTEILHRLEAVRDAKPARRKKLAAVEQKAG